MKHLFTACLVGLIIAFAQSTAAEEKKKYNPDAARGRSTSERLCVNCHVVKSGQTGNAIAGVPSFSAIANRPDQTSNRVANVLIQSHPPMPTVSLTRNEILDIITYLDTLRETGDPLMKKVPPPRTKPKYPDQS